MNNDLFKNIKKAFNKLSNLTKAFLYIKQIVSKYDFTFQQKSHIIPNLIYFQYIV